MKYVGIDLHKKSITICVVDRKRKVLLRRRLGCAEPAKIVETFQALGPFQAVVEATASYEWLFKLLEPLATKLVLAHPGKLRVIAESVKKTDKLDAQVLAEFLALGMIPLAYRPTDRQRQHRQLIRQRVRVQQRRSSVKCRIRYLLGDYNADRPDLFSSEGLAYLQAVELSPADQFLRKQLLAEYQLLTTQIKELDKELRQFGKQAPAKEAEARELLQTIPGVGKVVTEVVLAELGTVERFGSQKKVCAYAGLVPGKRESDKKSKDLPITKRGSPTLRWALVEAAWQSVRYSQKWRSIFENLARRRGKKRAIIAVARRLLGMMLALLRTGTAYNVTYTGKQEPQSRRPVKQASPATKAAKARKQRRRRVKEKALGKEIPPFTAEALAALDG